VRRAGERKTLFNVIEARTAVGLEHQRPDGADDGPEPLALLCAAVRAFANGETQPEALIGALLEGAAYTAHRAIPANRQSEVASAMLRLLAERLDRYGLFDPDQALFANQLPQ